MAASPAAVPAKLPALDAALLLMALRNNEELGERFWNCRIVGDVDLRGLEYGPLLTIHNAQFAGAFRAEDARFAKTVDLSGCTFEHGLLFDGAHVGGALLLNDTSLHALPEDATRALSLYQTRVARSLDLRKARAKAEVYLNEARIEGRCDLTSIAIKGSLSLTNAEIGADLWCRSLSNAEPRPTIKGNVNLIRAKVGGQADFTGIDLTGDLDLQGAEIGEALHCRSFLKDEPRPTIGGKVLLLGTKVGGQATFSGIVLTGDLNLQGAEIGADLSCRSLSNAEPRPTIGGNVILMGTKVGGQATFSGIDLKGDLNLLNAEIGADLVCRSLSKDEPRPTIGGKVRLSGTKVGGQAVFNGIDLTGDLNLQNAEIGAGLFCRSSSKDEPRPTIGGNVILSGTKVSGPADFSGIDLTGDLDCQECVFQETFFASSPQSTQPRTSIAGKVRLDGCTMEGETVFVGAKMGRFEARRAHFDDGLNLASATAAHFEKEYQGDRVTEAAAVDLTHSTLKGTLHLCGALIAGDTILHGVKLDGDLQAHSTKEHRTTLGHLQADGMEASGSVHLAGARIAQTLEFANCHIAGNLDTVLDGNGHKTEVANQSGQPVAVSLEFARIDGNCTLAPNLAGTHKISLEHAHLGELILDGDAPTDLSGPFHK
jgi:uncharacterized protein YjbI with pentapeptide repeats